MSVLGTEFVDIVNEDEQQEEKKKIEVKQWDSLKCKDSSIFYYKKNAVQ